jgi:hypothetical protein
VSGGEVGALLAVFGACLLLGAFASPLVRRLLPVRAVLLLELWTWVGCAAFLVWPNVYVLMASILPTALAIPSTDSVVNGYRIAMTPDRLLRRVESERSTIALLIAPARSARGGPPPPRPRVGARDDRRLRRVRPRARRLGDAEPVHPSGAELRRAGRAFGRESWRDRATLNRAREDD